MKNEFLVNMNSYHGFSLEEALAGAAKAGFKAVELAAVRGWTEHVSADMDDAQIQGVKDLLAKYGLKAVALAGHCNLMDENRLADFERNIELAHRFGCAYIVTSTGEAHFGEGEEFSNDVLVANIKKILPKLEATGIRMVLEIHGDYGTGESLYAITQAVASPYVGINYDTANVFFYGGKSPMDDIKTCYGDVFYVHLKDKSGAQKVWDFPGVGNGELPLKEFMEFMDSVGYEGPYSIEIEYTEAFTMRDKQPGDIDVANRELADSYRYLKSLGRI
jgi:sugar phosphate isomerase/epimerase